MAGSQPYSAATVCALSNRPGHHASTADTSTGPANVAMMMLEQIRMSASLQLRGHMTMKLSKVAKKAASKGTPSSLIQAAPAAVISICMMCFQLRQKKLRLAACLLSFI